MIMIVWIKRDVKLEYVIKCCFVCSSYEFDMKQEKVNYFWFDEIYKLVSHWQIL